MQVSSQGSPLQAYWEKHPLQASIFNLVKDGQWITHLFEWIFMYISRLAAYIMTFAVGYMIFYAIESKHALDATVANPQFPDILASLSSEIINVAPELVFPGVVVLCIRSFTARKWLDGACWFITSTVFAILTMTLLNAFMSGGITKEFLSVMLFWRAGAALFYTVVVAYCGGHGGLDFKTLLRELEEIHVQLDGKNHEVDTTQQRLKTIQSQVSTLQNELSSEQKKVSTLQNQLDTEQKKVSSFQEQLDSGQGETGQIIRELNAAKIQHESLSLQLETKNIEVEELKKALSSGQDWRVDRLTKELQSERERVSSLEKALEGEQKKVSTLRIQLDSVQVSSIQHPASTLVSSGQKKPSTIQQQGSSSGYENVLQLDANRSRRNLQAGQIEGAIRKLLDEKPGLSGQKIAAELGCSPTTASKWKDIIEKEKDGQSVQVVNE